MSIPFFAVKLENGANAVDFDGLQIDEEMLSAIALPNHEIARVIEASSFSPLGYAYRLTWWVILQLFAAVGTFSFLGLISFASDTVYINHSTSLSDAMGWLFGLALFVFIASGLGTIASRIHTQRTLRRKYHNLIPILRKLRSYNHIVARLRVVSEFKRLGMEVNTPADTTLPERLSQLRAGILKSLHADRIIRGYSNTWGNNLGDGHERDALNLIDLEESCARQMEEIQHSLNVESRLLDNKLEA
ncbi:hypothetical protein DB346_04655 [Verrucomicrobia bacterium LW23]|nr:hypothetical protein DB346_04655 [Verrucomicrobia bacterium LW23]